MHKACRTLVDLFRPSTTGFGAKKDVDGRDKHGHDGELIVLSQNIYVDSY